MNRCNLLQILILCFVIHAQGQEDAYIWRDFEGTVPADAFAAGLDRDGKTLYIGQVLFQDKLIPGKIGKRDSKIYFEWYSKEYSSDENVKIFCSSQAYRLKWINTNSTQVYNLDDKTLIRGGYESTFVTYIGRVFEGQTNVGKIICGVNNCLGLYTTDNGAAKQHQVFQILSYDRSAVKNDTDLIFLDKK